MAFGEIGDGLADALRGAGALAEEMLRPSVRLGVTGLARAGKTVFITALVHTLLHGGRLPFFDVLAQGRVRRAFLEPQPDDAVPRFDYEQHLGALTAAEPHWPESTRHISQLRVTLDYEPLSFWRRQIGPGWLHLDIVDYPGEWLLDLPLLGLSYEDWSREALALSRSKERRALAADWHGFLSGLDPLGPEDEAAALKGAGLFRAYLEACRSAPHALSVVPPGRFLLPGAFEGSPALSFFPLELSGEGRGPRGSLQAMMARRFESYKTLIVKPFFRDHFARLDRQIVLVDVLAALNGGEAAVADLERALDGILRCFRPGAKSWLASILPRRIDRILFAATKADHLPSSSHDRLEAILRLMMRQAMGRAEFAGAMTEAVALAALRATREGEAKRGGERLPVVIGRPLKGERLGAQIFDGTQETAIFPGDLPSDPSVVLKPGFAGLDARGEAVHFVRFRPPKLTHSTATPLVLPHIRLDRALQFLLEDKFA